MGYHLLAGVTAADQRMGQLFLHLGIWALIIWYMSRKRKD